MVEKSHIAQPTVSAPATHKWVVTVALINGAETYPYFWMLAIILPYIIIHINLTYKESW